MNEAEMTQGLKRLGLSLDDACEVVYIRTRAVIKARNIRKVLQEDGKLSWPTTAAFRFLFNSVEGGTNG